MVARFVSLAQQILCFAESIRGITAGIRGLRDLHRVLRFIKLQDRLVLVGASRGAFAAAAAMPACTS